VDWVGQTVSHYRILTRLGEGGMGVVYKAQDTRLNRPVAIKVLPPDALAQAERRQRFAQEAKAASALNHPNIVHIYAIESSAGQDYIVMEFVDGTTLDELLKTKSLPLDEALGYAVQLADALAAAHEAGIVHRDIKPGNVMLTGKGIVKVLDFGLAKLAHPEPVDSEAATRTAPPRTKSGMVVGTAAYMSPEQAQGKPVDARSDNLLVRGGGVRADYGRPGVFWHFGHRDP